MHKYQVDLARAETVYKTATFEVEAANKRKAMREAISKARSGATADWKPLPDYPTEYSFRVDGIRRVEVPPPAPPTETPSGIPPLVPKVP